jgi:hypothetical protein
MCAPRSIGIIKIYTRNRCLKKKKKKKSFRSIGSIYSYILSHICDSIIFFNPTGVDIHILNIHTISGNVLMIQWPFTFVSKKSR